MLHEPSRILFSIQTNQLFLFFVLTYFEMFHMTLKSWQTLHCGQQIIQNKGDVVTRNSTSVTAALSDQIRSHSSFSKQIQLPTSQISFPQISFSTCQGLGIQRWATREAFPVSHVMVIWVIATKIAYIGDDYKSPHWSKRAAVIPLFTTVGVVRTLV